MIFELKRIKGFSPGFKENIYMGLVILVGYEKGGFVVMVRQVMAE